MTKFKKLLKAEAKSGLVYFLSHEQNFFIGTRHWMIRIQTVSDKMRAALAEVGLYQQDMALNSGQPLTTMPNIQNVFPKEYTTDDWSEVNFLPFIHQDGKINARLGIRTNEVLSVNADFVAAMEELYGQSAWKQEKDLGPLILGNRLALILPYKCREALHKHIKALADTVLATVK